MRNDRFQKIASTCLMGTFVSVLLVVGTASYGQISGIDGQPLISKGGANAASDSSYFDVLVGESSVVGDMCAKIAAAWNGLPANSGTIDARGFTGAQACGVNPFATPTPKFGKLLLGNVIISTSVGWQIPTHVQVEGIGTATTANAPAMTANTIIRASSGFSSSSGALIQLGDGSSQTFDIGLKGVTVDCYGISGCSIGILNNSSEEGTTVEDVNVFNAPCVGVQVSARYTRSSEQRPLSQHKHPVHLKFLEQRLCSYDWIGGQWPQYWPCNSWFR